MASNEQLTANQTSTTFIYAQDTIPIFEGEAFGRWCSQMQHLFISQGLFDPVQYGYEQPRDAVDLESWDENKKKQYYRYKEDDAKALSFIQSRVSRAILPLIMTATTSKEAWEILKNEFQGSDKRNQEARGYLQPIIDGNVPYDEMRSLVRLAYRALGGSIPLQTSSPRQVVEDMAKGSSGQPSIRRRGFMRHVIPGCFPR